MKKTLLIILFALFSTASKAVRVTIIESQSYNSGHVMDQQWLALTQSLGHTSAIYPQTTLDNNSFFSTTDILVVSSGIIALPANRVNTILLYLQQGGKVYLQGEYLMSFDTDQAFQYLVNTLGGSFNWVANVSGNLIPTNVLGSLSNINKTVTPLSYFWYGVHGSGCANVEPFLEYSNNHLGFIFCPPIPGVGKLITTTDQDWIRTASTNEFGLMENILTNLLNVSYSCSGNNYPYLILGPDSALCPGDSIVLHAGAGFSSYQWQNGSSDSVFTVHGAGVYWVRVTTPCTTYTDTVTVILKSCVAAPIANFTSSDTAFCNEAGECISFFDQSTGNPTSWQWVFTGANPDTSTQQNPVNICYYNPGTYTVKLVVTNGGGSDTLEISPHIVFGVAPAPPVVMQAGDTLTVSSSFGTYQWFFNSYLIVGATDTFYVATQTGTYAVRVTDSLGCSSLSNGVYVGLTSVSVLHNEDALNLHPNPVNDKLIVTGSDIQNKIISGSVYDAIGNKVFSDYNPHSENYVLNVSGLSNGIYFFEINLNTEIIRRKFVVVHK